MRGLTVEYAGNDDRWHRRRCPRSPRRRAPARDQPGWAAARNTGARLASAPILAFLDDDCEPEPQWAEQLIAAYRADVIGVAGPLLAGGRPGFMLSYLARHNPLAPQELTLARSSRAEAHGSGALSGAYSGESGYN